MIKIEGQIVAERTTEYGVRNDAGVRGGLSLRQAENMSAAIRSGKLGNGTRIVSRVIYTGEWAEYDPDAD